MTDIPARCRFRWHNQEFSGDALYLVHPDSGPDYWRVRVDQSGPRFAAGTEIKVRQSEMIEMIVDPEL